jgi:hypothetical protein
MQFATLLGVGLSQRRTSVTTRAEKVVIQAVNSDAELGLEEQFTVKNFLRGPNCSCSSSAPRPFDLMWRQEEIRSRGKVEFTETKPKNLRVFNKNLSHTPKRAADSSSLRLGLLRLRSGNLNVGSDVRVAAFLVTRIHSCRGVAVGGAIYYRGVRVQRTCI